MSGANVQVAVRARPLSQREIDMKSSIALEMREKSTFLHKITAGVAVGDIRNECKEFVYDYSYWSVDPPSVNHTSQEQVFNNLGKSVLEAAFEGFNACVFAYGQTGSGKTFTMMGTQTAPGLIPRICEALFNQTATGSLRRVSYKTEASFMEIYNEKVRDLLEHRAAGNIVHGLKVREHPKDGPYVENLTKYAVSDYQSIEELMNKGNSNRVTASTKMNDVSSRSHAIFTITFTQATYSSDLPCETVSKINLVDLAGSERASATGAEGIRLKEGGNINKSLVCLGNVISALAEMSLHPNSSRKYFIPYRDSVLTWLLKDSLGGNSKTIMIAVGQFRTNAADGLSGVLLYHPGILIASVSPAECNYGETLSTLRYASRAKNIVNKPTVNEDPNVRLIRELKSEIKRLKQIIQEGHLQSTDQPGRARAMTELFSEDIQRKENQIAELTKTWAGKWEGVQSILEDRNLALHSEGIKMTVASEQPHFLSVDDNALGTGVVIYHLQGEATTIGAVGSNPRPDIELAAADIKPEHCIAKYMDGKVFLTPLKGATQVNEIPIIQETKLTHGDLVQLGSTTVFRFNHPEELAEMKHYSELRGGGHLFQFSPLARDTLEKERLAMEKHYEDKLEAMRKEMEVQNERDKCRLKQELEKIKSSLPVTVPSLSDDDSLTLGSPGAENDPYNIMKSIAFAPVGPLKIRSNSFNIKDITGEREASGHELTGYNSDTCSNGIHSRSTSQTPPLQLPLLSPATGQHNSTTSTNIEESNSPQMKELLSTYEVVQNDDMLRALHTSPVDIPDGSSPQYAASGTFDIGYVTRNLTRFQVDGDLCRSCPVSEPSNGVPGAVDSAEPDILDKLSMVEQQLDGDCDRVARRRPKKRDTEQIRTLAKRLSKDLAQLQKEKEEYSQENADLKQKLEYLVRDHTQEDTKETNLDYRRRSYAHGEKDMEEAYPLRRTYSLNYRRPRLKFNILQHYLRGRGFTSYHIYEIEIQLGKDKWRVHRRYNDFQNLHEELKRRYPQLTTLALPQSKWIGFKTESFVQQRRIQLEHYLQSLVAVLGSLHESPMKEKKFTKEELMHLSSFFRDKGNVYGVVL